MGWGCQQGVNALSQETYKPRPGNPSEGYHRCVSGLGWWLDGLCSPTWGFWIMVGVRVGRGGRPRVYGL